MAKDQAIKDALDKLEKVDDATAMMSEWRRARAWRDLVQKYPDADVFGLHAARLPGGADELEQAVIGSSTAAAAALAEGKVTSLGRHLLDRPVTEVLARAKEGGTVNSYAQLLLSADNKTFEKHEDAFFAAAARSQDGAITRFIEILTREHEGSAERYAERFAPLIDSLSKPYNQFIAGALLLDAYGERFADKARALLVGAMQAVMKKGGSSDMIGLLGEHITGGLSSLKIRVVDLLCRHFGAAALDDIKAYHEENDAIRLQYLRLVKERLGDAAAPILLSRGLFHTFDKRSKYGDVDYKTYLIRCLGILEGVDFSSGQKRIWKDFAGHKTEKIRDAASAALAGLGEAAIEPAKTHLAAKDAATRGTAVAVLAGVGTPAALALLEAHAPSERSKKLKLLIETRLAQSPSATEKKATTKKATTKKATTKKAATKKAATNKAATKKASAAPALGDQRDAELEALLAEDPDDVERALVYGDWLQGRGHPRGTLIALQAAAAAAPADQARTKEIDAWLEQHADVLWGFSKRQGERVEASWSLGFVRSARLAFDARAPLLETLRALLSHPSACVLQRLTIDPFVLRGAAQLEVEPVVELLLELGAPLTLTHLSIGAPGQFRGDDRLAEVFARLSKSGAELLAEALARVASQRTLKVPFDAAALSELAPRDEDFEGEIDKAAILVGLRLEIDKQRPVGVVEAVARAFTPASVDAFALSLLDAWRARGSRSNERWAFDAVGALGGEKCAASLGAELPELSHQRAVQGVEHLMRIGSEAAVCEVIGLWLTPSRYQPRRDEAEEALLALARARGIELGELVVRSCPRGASGAAKTRAVAVQRLWLARAMIDGERIAARAFRDHVMYHALRAPLCRGLLIGRFAPGGKRDALFRVGDDGPIDANGKRVDVGKRDDETVGVMHSLELDDKERSIWRKAFDKARIEQPFEQLQRPTFALDDDELASEGTKRFAKQRVGFHRIREGLEARDWSVYEQDHGIEAFGRRFGRGEVVIVADLRQNSGAVDELWATRPSQARRGLHAKRLPLAEVDPIVLSEALYDVASTVGPARGASATKKKAPAKKTNGGAAAKAAPAATAGAAGVAGDVLAQTGRYPYAELAKSSRSKCVICGEKIEKGSVRVGVERLIETPNFSGRATSWLHPGCRDKCPELATVDDVEAALTRNSSGVWPPS